MQTSNAQQRTVRPYPEMVARLFKTLDTDAATLHHATTGMAGETAELLEGFVAFRKQEIGTIGKSLDNMREELGDWRFYAQAVWNIYGWEMDSFVLPLPGSSGTVRNAIDQLIIHSGAILDISKKDWIYGKEVDARALHEQMEGALAAYKDILHTMGWTDLLICNDNRNKLAKRYPEGVYSDTDAIARADKA